MKNLGDLAKSMQRLKDAIPEEGNRVAIKCAESVLRTLVNFTPVDTSRAKSNWLVTVGSSYVEETIKPYFPGRRGSTSYQSSQRAIHVGNMDLAGKNPGETIWIVNALTYIEKISERANTPYLAVYAGLATVKNYKLFQNYSAYYVPLLVRTSQPIE